MLKTDSLKRRILFSAVLMTLLGAAVQTANATDMRQVRAALISSGRGLAFNFMGGSATPETVLVIDNISDSGAFTGKYYPYSGEQPATDNVSGTITIISGEAIRITFTVNAERVGGIIGGTTTFDGALRLGTGDTHPSFMAGTYTLGRTVPVPRRAPGPFPFCATFAVITPG